MVKKISAKAQLVLRLKRDAPYLGRRRIALALGLPGRFVRSVLEQNTPGQQQLTKPTRCDECGQMITVAPCITCRNTNQ